MTYCISKSSEKYPLLLKKISDPPCCLYCNGDISLLNKVMITFVGTRDISAYGEQVLDLLLDKFLKDLDIVVVSGLARGVDAYVHRICLKRDIQTIAVLPLGLTHIYPQENESLCREIESKGLVISEYMKVPKPHKGLFARRNRILAGISTSTVIVQAGVGSGSLLTAQLVLDYNRDLYVIPGRITEYTSHGCNMLIREGAEILTCMDDFKETFKIYKDQLHI